MKNSFFMILIAIVSLALFSCKEQETSAQQPGAMPPPNVDTVLVQQLDIPVAHEYFGRTAGYQEVEVHARVEGILLERAYQEGERVQQGDVLFRIDPKPYQTALDHAKARLQQEQAGLKEAQRNWDRISKLYQDKAVSESERDRTESALESAAAGVALAEAELRSAQINLDYTIVKAPISGITSREVRSEGSLVRPGTDSSMLTRITRTDPVYVIFSYPDADYIEQQRKIASGQYHLPENGKLKAEIIFPDGSVYDTPGYVDFTESFIDRETGTIEARAVLDNPNRQIIPGQFVRLRVSGLIQNDALVILPQCVMQDPQGQYVYRVDDQQTAQIARIKTGASAGEFWTVEQGLAAGDRIISNGLLHVIPDQAVTIDQNNDDVKTALVP